MKEEPSDWVDDIPSADPQIQKNYEAALGKFLVAFNEVEATVGDIIFLALKKAERSEIFKLIPNERYASKILALDLISLTFPKVASIELIGELRSLGGERNRLAHGHFDQNPFDGSYEIVAGKKRQNISIEKIQDLTEQAGRVHEQLRYSQAWFYFDDVTIVASDQDESIP